MSKRKQHKYNREERQKIVDGYYEILQKVVD